MSKGGNACWTVLLNKCPLQRLFSYIVQTYFIDLCLFNFIHAQCCCQTASLIFSWVILSTFLSLKLCSYHFLSQESLDLSPPLVEILFNLSDLNQTSIKPFWILPKSLSHLVVFISITLGWLLHTVYIIIVFEQVLFPL